MTPLLSTRGAASLKSFGFTLGGDLAVETHDLIYSASPSGIQTLNFSSSLFPIDYDMIEIRFINLAINAVNTSRFQFQLNASGYSYNIPHTSIFVYNAPAALSYNSSLSHNNSTAYVPISYEPYYNQNMVQLTCKFYKLLSTTQSKNFFVSGLTPDTDTGTGRYDIDGHFVSGYFDTTNAITNIQFNTSANSYFGCDYEIYGIKT